MNKVYVVRSVNSLDYEGSPDVEHIASSIEKAEQYINREYPKARKIKYASNDFMWRISTYEELYIEEWEIDSII